MDRKIQDIEKYLTGKLTPAEMHALEKQALHDPFLAEALEGAEQSAHDNFSEDIAELNRKIFKHKANKWIWTVRIAASLLLLAVAAFIVWTTLDDSTSQNLALRETVIVNDSLFKTIPQAQSSATQKTETKPADSSGSKKESGQPSGPKLTQPVNKKAHGPAAENKNEASSTRNQVRSIKRENQLEKNEVAGIDPAKSRLQPPSSTDIKLAEGYIKSVDAKLVTTITGQVMSAEDGMPLRDVRVGFKGTSLSTKTDASGRYSITGYSENKTLVYSSEGLESTEVKIEGTDSTYLPVKLEITEEAQLEEAVESSQFDDYPTHVTTIPAHPEKGNRAFKQYLQRNYQYPDEAIEKRVEGVVIIEFKVDTKGSLSEFKIVRGIGTGCDEEVIRLILQGVKWVPTTKDGVPVADKARVRFKFELD